MKRLIRLIALASTLTTMYCDTTINGQPASCRIEPTKTPMLQDCVFITRCATSDCTK